MNAGKKLRGVAFGWLAMLLLTVGWAQAEALDFDLRTETARTRTVQALSAQAAARRQAALALAHEQGWPVRGRTADGR